MTLTIVDGLRLIGLGTKVELEEARVLERTHSWLQKIVRGLQLCPFAGPVIDGKTLRLAVSASGQVQQQLKDFLTELDRLQVANESEVATSLLILPIGLESFGYYLDFLAEAKALLEASGLGNEVQLASFHPDYIFEGEPADDVSHYTNRSPYPMLHLIREPMLSRILEDFPNSEDIPQQNIARLRALGIREIQRLWLNI